MNTAEKIPKKMGSALFSYGFRPFFLFGATWAAVAMLLWVMILSGLVTLPTRLDPVSWHAHEVLFGYLGAVIAGFLLTAVPNWTGRAPVAGWQLAALVAVWAAGRIVIAVSSWVPALLPAAVDLAFPILLGVVILREIIVGKNWRNLVIIVLLALFTLANLMFHIEAARGDMAAQGTGLRLGVATVLLMISVIGGRIIPAFTRNWLLKNGQRDLPAAPMQRFDIVTLVATVVALICWVTGPASTTAGFVLLIMGGLHSARLIRWKGYHTVSEPLMWALHLGYLFVPLGALTEGFAILFPEGLSLGGAQHLWMAGAFGMMTLAVMTRATLGHTGHEIRGGVRDIAMFICVVGSVLSRISASIWPQNADVLYVMSAAFWVAAFGIFIFVHGASLLKPTPAQAE